MINTIPGEPFTAILIEAPIGLVGTLTFSIINATSGAVVVAPRTTGILEVAPGTYTTQETLLSVGSYIASWSDEEEIATEEITVGTDLPLEGTYASVGDVRGYAPELVTYSHEEIRTEIVKAERDLDWWAGFGGLVNETSGLRFDPLADLDPRFSSAITRATCAQVQYRFYMGPAFFTEELGYEEVQGRDQTVRKGRRVGPQARSEFPRALRKMTGKIA